MSVLDLDGEAAKEDPAKTMAKARYFDGIWKASPMASEFTTVL
jgi:hypothetical protein